MIPDSRRAANVPALHSTLRYLYGLQSRGMKFGLKNIQALLSALGNPHRNFPSIHIAGTNGKGSTAAMIAAILAASGYKTGLYTSPHLVRFTERIRINGKEISESDVVRVTRLLRPLIEEKNATFFEATTALAFQYFSEKKVDVAVIETGLGGRLDATNVLSPLLTVITSIGLDHTEILGNRIEDIAREKGGIIKPGAPCLVGNVSPRAAKVLKKIADRRKVELHFILRDTDIDVKSSSHYQSVFDVRGPFFKYGNLVCSLAGTFQENNLALSLAATTIMSEMGFREITRESVRRGLSRIRRHTGLQGRLEVISHNPLTIIDVAHNPAAAQSLVDSLRMLNIHRVVTVFGVMVEKDLPGIVRELRRTSRLCVAVAPTTKRAAAPDVVARLFHEMGSRCINGGNVRNGVALAIRETFEGEPILVTGSHYVVGEFLEWYEKS